MHYQHRPDPVVEFFSGMFQVMIGTFLAIMLGYYAITTIVKMEAKEAMRQIQRDLKKAAASERD
ncbi:MAG: hypothetical protein KGR24_03425 [Planctomycetes bacterium]|nr:hypothetical protein [Planctomycetota bacterium]